MYVCTKQHTDPKPLTQRALENGIWLATALHRSEKFHPERRQNVQSFRKMELINSSWSLYFTLISGMRVLSLTKVAHLLIPQSHLPMKQNYFDPLSLPITLTYRGGLISVSLSGNWTRASSSSNFVWATVSCSNWKKTVNKMISA